MPFSAPAKYPGAVAGVGDLLNLKDEVGSPTLPTLAASILSTDTSFSVAAGTGALLPTDNFLITVESEIMFVGSRATDTLSSVTRGAQGTAAASHAAGTAVNQFYNAIHHNQVASEVNAIETLVGAAPAAHGVLLAEGTSPLVSLVPGASGTILASNGAAADPSWQAAVSSGGLVGASASAVAVTATTTFYLPYAGGGVSSTTETAVDTTAPASATISKLYVDVSAAPGTGNTFVVTLRKNGASTALTATISGAATTANDTADSVTVVAGDLLTWQLTATGTITVTPNFTISSQWGGSAVGGSALPWTSFVPATIVAPVLSQFTATDAPAGSSAVQNTSSIFLTSAPTGSENWATWLKTAPATPYTITMGIFLIGQASQINIAGITLRESSTGKFIQFSFRYENTNPPVSEFNVRYQTSATLNSSEPILVTWRGTFQIAWLSVTNDGTNLIFKFLPDGLNSIQLLSASKTAFLASGPNQVGFGLENFGGAFSTYAVIVHWSGA